MSQHKIPKILKVSEQGGEPVRALFTAQHAPKIVRRAVLQSLRQVQTQLEEVDARAQQIIAQAEQQAEAIREQAREQGRAEALSELLAALNSARGEYARLIDEAEQDIVTLAMEVAQRIVHRQLQLSPETLRDILRGALELVRDKRQITVLVHPDDLELVSGWRHELSELVEARTIFFEADERVEHGGCFIETEAGRVDARLSTQLDTFKRALST